MTLEQIVPVPYQIQRRAWECAWDICCTSDQRANRDALLLAIRAYNGPVERITWAQAGALLRLHRELWPRRVA
ncbi:hypothetical protein [Caldovatus sediminis]|uniref:hypothetical protein n=1 Tax=Caldovatus sediminis TaxID=2041189 RepID=UPI00166EC4EB|nr:hypothetical protein [Caldovatus sediminis]